MNKTVTLFVRVLVALMVLGVGRSIANADTVQLTLTGTGTATWGSDYIYPYYFTVKDGNTTASNIALMCISFDRTITVGETWDATLMTAAAADTQYSTTNYEEAAYFLSLAATGNDPVADQLAAWYLFDPNNPTLAAEMTQGAWNLVDNPPSGSSLNQYANDPIYIAQDGSAQYGLAQDFVGLTPEPGTWAMLGSGLIGVIAMVYFRRRSAFVH